MWRCRMRRRPRRVYLELDRVRTLLRCFQFAKGRAMTRSQSHHVSPRASKTSVPELCSRVHSGFSARTLRRSGSEFPRASDPGCDAVSTAEIEATLNTEIRRAERYERKLALLTFGVERSVGMRGPVAAQQLHSIVGVIARSLRACSDSVGHLQARGVFAIVLPEAGATEAWMVSERVMGALKQSVTSGEALIFSYGVAALEDRSGPRGVTAESLIALAERRRMTAGA